MDPVYLDVTLPSLGVPYVDPTSLTPLIPGGNVQIRAFNGGDEALLNDRSMKDHSRMSRILTACTKFPTTGFNARNLLVSDRLVLLMLMRAHSLGEKYKLDCECDACNAKFVHEIDISKDLEVENMPRSVEDADGNASTNTYNPVTGIEVELPSSKAKVALRLLTGADEEFMAIQAQNAKSPFLPQKIQGSRALYMKRVLQLKSLNGVEINHSDPIVFADAARVVAQMPLSDLNFIDDTIDAYDVEVNNFVTATCPACGEESEVQIVMTPEFFRPTNNRRKRA